MHDDRQDEIAALERAFWLEGGGDPDFWAENFAEDGIVALAFGLMDKPAVVEAMGGSVPWDRVDMDDVRFTHTDDSTVMAYRAQARAQGTDSDYTAVVSSVYRFRDDRWMLLFHQQTEADSTGSQT